MVMGCFGPDAQSPEQLILCHPEASPIMLKASATFVWLLLKNLITKTKKSTYSLVWTYKVNLAT